MFYSVFKHARPNLSVYLDKTGYFVPLGINWKGNMQSKELAIWLPNEYSIKEEQAQSPVL